VPDAVGVAAAEDEVAAVELDAEVAEVVGVAEEDEVVGDEELEEADDALAEEVALANPAADGVPWPPTHVFGSEPEPMREKVLVLVAFPPPSSATIW
jgi:hypothetical protein